MSAWPLRRCSSRSGKNEKDQSCYHRTSVAAGIFLPRPCHPRPLFSRSCAIGLAREIAPARRLDRRCLNQSIPKPVAPPPSEDQRTGNAFYTVRIAVPEVEVARLHGLKIIPGMPVEALIQTESRTMLSYLIKPLMDQVTRTFRGSRNRQKELRRIARCRCSSLLLSAWFRPVATFLLCVFTFRARGET